MLCLSGFELYSRWVPLIIGKVNYCFLVQRVILFPASRGDLCQQGSNSAKVVIKKTNKKDKNTKPTRIRRQDPITYSYHGAFTDQFIFRKILTNQSARPRDLENFCLPFDEVQFSFLISYTLNALTVGAERPFSR